MIRKVVFTVIGTGMLAICDLQAQAMLTPMVTLKQPRFNVGVKAGFNSSMFFTDEISINGKKLEMAQNNYKVGYLAAVFCRFNLKKHHFIQPEFSCNITQGSVSIPFTLANSELLKENALIKKKQLHLIFPFYMDINSLMYIPMEWLSLSGLKLPGYGNSTVLPNSLAFINKKSKKNNTRSNTAE